MRSKYNTNHIIWQVCLPLGDKLSVKCNNENSKKKVAISCAKEGFEAFEALPIEVHGVSNLDHFHGCQIR